MPDQHALLTVEAYAELLGRSPRTVYKAIGLGTTKHPIERIAGQPLLIRVPLVELGLERRAGGDRRLEPRPGGRERRSNVPKIPCPHCGASESSIIASRASIRREGIRRRRFCTSCAKRFTTIEIIDPPHIAPDTAA